MNIAISQEKSKVSFFGLTWGAWIASVLTASAYVVGRSYHDAYMETLGFNHEFYAKSVQDYWFYSVSASIEAILFVLGEINSNPRIIALIVGAAIFIMIIFRLANKIDKSSRVQSAREQISKSRGVGLLVNVAAWPVFSLVLFVNVPVFVCFVLIFPGFIGERVGQYVAKKDFVVFSKACSDPLAERFCTSVKVGDVEIMRGHVADVANGYVAFTMDGNAVSIPVEGKTFELIR